ncbi:extracellular solute-binding protein [Halobaculum litoreum]|uniref:extracellular solute-binding protein n=1 Tax=Halobaculum litoreum TaxID=3031998 RepID=UPI0024C3955F|nr:extracellular solute-binding protein [Halobaculum sp. DT92]
MTVTRRAVLAGTGAVGLAGATGCVGRTDRESVSVLAAGSLARAFDERLRPRVDAPLELEFHGSAVCARLVAEGLRDPDVLVLADPALFAGLADRYTAFATNEVVVAYDPARPGGRAVRDSARPFDPFLDRDLPWGRTDPDADPLGYRTVFALRLAASLWGRPYATALDAGRVIPEAELLAVFAAGELDAAVVYRNMALDHGVAYRRLPPTVNLGSPAHAAAYADHRYELPDGTTVVGAPVSYGAVARRDDPAVAAAFRTLVAGEWTGDAFGVPATYPRVEPVASR